MRILPVALGMTLVLAGCLSPVEVLEPRDATFYFTQSGLEEYEINSERFPIAWTWEDYAANIAPERWTSGSFEAPAWVTEATLTITYELENVASVDADVAPFSRPPLTSWFGVDGTNGPSIISHEFGEGPAVASNDEVTVTWSIELPSGGLYVPDDGRLLVYVGTYYSHQDGVYLDAARSQLDVRLEPAPHVGGFISGGEESLEVRGAACIVRDPSDSIDQVLVDEATDRFTFEVTEDAGFVEVDINGGIGDADFFLQRPDGTRAVYALGPGPVETVLLGPGTVSGNAGTWTVVAYACSETSGTIEAAWRVYEAPPEPPSGLIQSL